MYISYMWIVFCLKKTQIHNWNVWNNNFCNLPNPFALWWCVLLCVGSLLIILSCWMFMGISNYAWKSISHIKSHRFHPKTLCWSASLSFWLSSVDVKGISCLVNISDACFEPKSENLFVNSLCPICEETT